MNRKSLIILSIMTAAIAGTMAGCGGGGSTAASTTVNGVVADGYLKGAMVFVDRNGTFRWDGTEPHTLTGPGGSYTLTMSADDTKYPIVVEAIAGSTVDEDTNQTVQNGFVMAAPAGSGSFVSPMSTLIQAKMAANPSLTVSQAATQLRNQLNMPAGMDVMADYVAGGSTATNQYQTRYQEMHQVAQQMASLMGSQAGLVMAGGTVNTARYQAMMGLINQNMPQIAQNAYQNMGMGSTFMTSMMTQLQTTLSVMTGTGTTFSNYSGMFRNMTSLSYFWNYSGGQMVPGSGMTGGTMMSGSTTGTTGMM